jgi:hypothetical protein
MACRCRYTMSEGLLNLHQHGKLKLSRVDNKRGFFGNPAASSCQTGADGRHCQRDGFATVMCHQHRSAGPATSGPIRRRSKRVAVPVAGLLPAFGLAGRTTLARRAHAELHGPAIRPPRPRTFAHRAAVNHRAKARVDPATACAQLIRRRLAILTETDRRRTGGRRPHRRRRPGRRGPHRTDRALRHRNKSARRPSSARSPACAAKAPGTLSPPPWVPHRCPQIPNGAPTVIDSTAQPSGDEPGCSTRP